MQIHISPGVDDGELPVMMNPGSRGGPFGIIRFTDYKGAEIIVESDEDADRIIRAAAKVKAMRAVLGTPHPFASTREYGIAGGHCDLCGMLDDSPDHADPAPLCEYCDVEPATEGKYCEACAPAVLLADSIITGTPLTVDSDEDGPMDDEAELRRAEEIRDEDTVVKA